MYENIDKVISDIKAHIDNIIKEDTVVSVHNSHEYFILTGKDKLFRFDACFICPINFSDKSIPIENRIDGAMRNININEENVYVFTKVCGEYALGIDISGTLDIDYRPMFERVFNEKFETFKKEGIRVFIFKSKNYEFHLVSTFSMGKNLHEIESALRDNFERGEYTQGEIYRLA